MHRSSTKCHEIALPNTLSYSTDEACGWTPSLRQRAKRPNQTENLSLHALLFSSRSSPLARSDGWAELTSKRYPDITSLTFRPLCAILLSLMLTNSLDEILLNTATRLRELRLAQNLSQAGLAARAGVSVSVLRLFERTGKISFESLVKLAIALKAEAGIDNLFQPQIQPRVTIDELLQQNNTRKRGRLK